MPGISLCRNQTCPLRPTCYRAQCPPERHSFRQSWAHFKPDEHGKCERYWPLDERRKPTP